MEPFSISQSDTISSGQGATARVDLENDMQTQIMKGIQMYMQKLSVDQQTAPDLLRQSFTSLPEQPKMQTH